MIKPSAPCLKCEDRRQFCHAECKRYKTFRAELDKYNEAIASNNRADTMVTNYECNRAIQIKKKY